jgi:hypothetical protein
MMPGRRVLLSAKHLDSYSTVEHSDLSPVHFFSTTAQLGRNEYCTA